MTLKEAVLKTIQQLTLEDKEFLNRHIAGSWNLNPKTGLIDAEGSVYISYLNLTQIPYKFGKVTKDFACSHNQLTSLEGCPKIVMGHFNCENNQLQSFKYLPKMIQNYSECMYIINMQKVRYLKNIGFDQENTELFKELFKELENEQSS